VKRLLFLFLLALAPRAAAADPAAPRIEAPTHPVAPVADEPTRAPEPADRRPFYLAGGVVVLALIFWWNRERARKLEREHGPTPPRQRRWRVKPDADSEALADAAEDPDRKEEQDE
jgi:hypothetical protein